MKDWFLCRYCQKSFFSINQQQIKTHTKKCRIYQGKKVFEITTYLKNYLANVQNYKGSLTGEIKVVYSKFDNKLSCCDFNGSVYLSLVLNTKNIEKIGEAYEGYTIKRNNCVSNIDDFKISTDTVYLHYILGLILMDLLNGEQRSFNKGSNSILFYDQENKGK